MYYENDDDEVPMDNEDYQYADEDENEERNVRHLRGQMFDDDDEDDDNDERSRNEEQPMKHHHRQRDDQNRSRESDADEMNLIDYVIEEEKEIGGAKGEDSHSLSGSTTYSR